MAERTDLSPESARLRPRGGVAGPTAPPDVDRCPRAVNPAVGRAAGRQNPFSYVVEEKLGSHERIRNALSLIRVSARCGVHFDRHVRRSRRCGSRARSRWRAFACRCRSCGNAERSPLLGMSVNARRADCREELAPLAKVRRFPRTRGAGNPPYEGCHGRPTAPQGGRMQPEVRSGSASMSCAGGRPRSIRGGSRLRSGRRTKGWTCCRT